MIGSKGARWLLTLQALRSAVHEQDHDIIIMALLEPKMRIIPQCGNMAAIVMVCQLPLFAGT